jgi:two-component system repressor protein LuxO
MKTSSSPLVLLIEDTVALATVFATHLKNDGIDVHTCHLAADAHAMLDENTYSLVLLDLQLPDQDGLDLLREIRRRGIQTMVIVVTSDASTDRTVEAMRVGAKDYLVKPLEPARLLVTVRNALELVTLRERVDESSPQSHYEGFIGSSKPMQAVYRAIDNISQSKATVFISGESGTGKELCAEAIHKKSPRSDGPFIAINCGAIPKDLIESELFGHVKGAFTGAVSERRGAAGMADGGTLFLDEICEMDISLQTKLLRFLQTSTVQRLGSQTVDHVDVRVICATNRTPIVEVAEGRVREDLFYRLNVIPIHLPPLRERGEDSVLIANDFLRRFCKEESRQFIDFGQSAIDAILGYSWPGNVRELQNIVRRVTVMYDGEHVEAHMLPDSISANSPEGLLRENDVSQRPTDTVEHLTNDTTSADSWVPQGLSLAHLEREIIESTIRRNNNSITEAAKVLGVSPSTIYRKRSSWESSDS